MLYLDHAATTPLRPEAREAMTPFLDEAFGNPSGVHGVSRRAKNALEEARERAAALLGATHPLEIVFTGGGTESDNLAVKGVALAGGGRRGIVTTAIEHDGVLASARFARELGCPLTEVGVGPAGTVDADELVAAVGADTALVSVMAANNETGAIQPLDKVAVALREIHPGVSLHTDAIQAFVSEVVTVESTGADLISLSAHKFGGPKGVGLLFVRDGISLEPAVHGGGQELGRRSGTHNVSGIVGMVAAMEATVADRQGFRSRVGEARRRFESSLKGTFPGVVFTGDAGTRLVQHSHFRIPGIPAETALIRLDRSGVAAAAGSACHSGAVEVSHVLAAMGMTPAEAAECIRITFGWTTRPVDGDAAARLVGEALGAGR